MPAEDFQFEGHAGVPLAGLLDRPAGRPLATALLAHCFTCGKDLHAARRIARRLAAQGFAVLRFDFTGLGGSGGAFEDTSFASNAADLAAAARALDAAGMPPDLMIGHSLGGAAAVIAAERIASLKALVTIGAPFEPAHVTGHFGEALAHIARDGAAEVNLGGRPVRIGRSFVEDVTAARLEPALGGLTAALLVLHAPRDAIVGIDNAGRIFGAARHPKSFVTLDDADHLLSRPQDADYAAGVIAAWAERYLDLHRPAPPPGLPEGVTRSAEADPDGFLQDITNGPHHLQADEPEAYGGTNRGLSPYGLLAAGLGACTAMTIRMYARRKRWPLRHVAVDVSHDRVHAQDCDACVVSDDGGMIDRFRRRITLEGPLDADQRRRLLEIADRCPVHRTLERRATIRTALTDEAATGAAAAGSAVAGD